MVFKVIKNNFLSKKSSILLLISLFLIIFGCKEEQKMTYIYSDSYNNNYSLCDRILEFTPVTSTESSSGIYSKRKGFKLKLTPEYNKKLLAAFCSAVENKGGHLEKRLMGSGFLKTKESNIETVYLLSRRSVEKIAIDKLLKKIDSE